MIFRQISELPEIHSVTTELFDCCRAPCDNIPWEEARCSRRSPQPEKFQGRCVAISGVMQRTFLFESVDGVYLQSSDRLNPASNGFRLGLDNLSGRVSERYRHVSVLGRVQDCETVRNCVDASTPEGEVVMVMGYCHYFNGPYVWVDDIKYKRGPAFERRMGSYDRKDYGDLEPAPEDWPHRGTVEALAREFLRALRSKDRERLAGLHFRDVGLQWDEDEAALLDFLLRSDQSPFSSIRTSPMAPQEITLIERSRLDSEGAQQRSPSEVADYSATVCFCREKSCAGRWPLATFDADNLPSRPYACTEIGPYLVAGNHWVPHFTTRIGRDGLSEPRGPR
jgi:hypothetical protein